jgi:hypothetical protein
MQTLIFHIWKIIVKLSTNMLRILQSNPLSTPITELSWNDNTFPIIDLH